MKLLFSSFNRQIVFLIIILIFGSVFLPIITKTIKENERESNQMRLDRVHQQALETFERGIQRFATLMSGVRAYMVSAPTFPTQDELRDYVAYQLRDIEYSDNLIISFIDTSHVFQYSFDQREIDPANLIGTSVRAIRDQDEIDRLDKVLADEQFHLFKPINLVEGLVGLPINFSIVRDGKVLGYIAAIIDIKTLVYPIYSANKDETFAHHFTVGDHLEFDRERVYDGSHVYNDQIDSAYFKKYGLEEADMQYSTLEVYNLAFKIGSAFVNPHKSELSNLYFSELLYSWYGLLIIFICFSGYRVFKFRRLNLRLQASFEMISFQSKQLQSNNEELKKVVHTKDKLFSIIGHDLRSPLNALMTIMALKKSKKISDDESNGFIIDVEDAAKQNLTLLDNLLKWSMHNSDIDHMKKVDFKMIKLVDETLNQTQLVASTKGLILLNQVNEGIMFYADYQMMNTVVRNLISNAIKFSYSGNVIEVDARMEDDYDVLSVSDYGVGMGASEIDGLFQINNDNVRRGTSDEPGTGLGLVVVQDFVKRHNGKLKVYSEEGRGSKFEVWLPKARTEAVLVKQQVH